MNNKKLYRNKSEGKIFGVCAGIADFLALDVSAVRLISVIFQLFFPPTILLYLFLSFILDENPNERQLSQHALFAHLMERLDHVRDQLKKIEKKIIHLEAEVTSDEFMFKKKIKSS